MFNIGSNDKEELEENMEEIKNLIGKSKEGKQSDPIRSNGPGMEETQSSKPRNVGDPQAGMSSPQTSSSHGKENPEDMSKDLGDKNTGSQDQSPTSQQEDSNMQRSKVGQNGFHEQESIQAQDQPRQDDVLDKGISSTQTEDTSGQEEESIPNEPLFLGEEEFNKIREMVEEMTYLTQEMDQKVKNMKRNVREEKDTSRDSRELSKAFDERRREIKSVIESSR